LFDLSGGGSDAATANESSTREMAAINATNDRFCAETGGR